MPSAAGQDPLQDHFGARLYAAGRQAVAAGQVTDVRVLQGGLVIIGIVSAGAALKHRVYIRRANQKIEGECSCSERAPCVHVAAVSIAASSHEAEPVQPTPRPALATGAGLERQRLFYTLHPANPLSLAIGVGQSAGSLQPFTLRAISGSTDFPRYVDQLDKAILPALAHIKMEGPWELDVPATNALLARILATGRAYWQAVRGGPLRPGAARRAEFSWEILPDGTQRLRCESAAHVLLAIEHPIYIDSETAEWGALEPDLPLHLLRRYSSFAPITPEAVPTTNADIATAHPQFPRLRPLAVEKHSGAHLQPRLVLSAGPAAALYFVYNRIPIDAARLDGDREHVRQAIDDTVFEIPRDQARELRLRRQLEAVLPAAREAGKEEWLEFMLTGVPALRSDAWEVVVESDFPYRLAHATDWYGDLDHDHRHGWFNLRLGVTVEGRPVNLLPAIVHYLQLALTGGQIALGEPDSPGLPPRQADLATAPDEAGQRVGAHWLVRLDDGRYLPIAIERIQRIAETLVELFERDSLTREDALQLPLSQTGRLVQLARELDGPALRTNDTDLRALLDDLQAGGGIQPREAPEHFQAVLRPYQKEGLGWLQFLRRHGLGGILADDMGLGKTVQTLAHLASEKAAGRLLKPALIVAPVSTLGNWQQELHRFAGDLSGLVLHGSRRRESFSLIARVDVVITGYPLLQLDSETLLAHEYSVVILDEAQTIKNPRAKVSLLARALRAEQRLALTGTPVENHLGELWSLCDFVQAGLLGSERDFQRHYRTPIEKNGNRARAQALAQRVAPFLLRRTKDAVAADLPPKTQIVESVVLEERQRDFYDGIRLASHRHIQQVVRQQGLARSQLTILDALLKLRQACCDPRLIGTRDIPSAKLEWLTTALPELIAGERRILLFSQFTSMLKLIETAVVELGIPYCVLTGETQHRADVIARFQSGAVPLFLISLKAGGTGLNLTAADTVIHYDPWWNPAVEAQATDRAHRIGQDKPVFVYKLIAQGTVEERIMQLQADKHALASRLFSATPGTPASWTPADLEALFAP